MSYRISVQPDIRKTLADPGVIVGTLQLDPETYMGIVQMAYCLFHRPNAHIRILNIRTRIVDPIDVDRLDNQHFVTHVTGPVIELLADDYPWRLAIEHPTNDELQRPITMRYSCMFQSAFLGVQIQEYWIFQFDDLRFLQGAISACQWYHLDPHKQIRDLHDLDTEVVF